MLTCSVWSDLAACAGCGAVTAQGGGAASYVLTGHPGPGLVLLGSASIAKPSDGAGFGPLPQAFALALLSSPLVQQGMVLELIFTATPMLAVWSLIKAFRRAQIPQISQLPSCPSVGSRDLPLTSFASMPITFLVPAGTLRCFLPS